MLSGNRDVLVTNSFVCVFKLWGIMKILGIVIHQIFLLKDMQDWP